MADKYIRLQDAQDIVEMAINDDWETDYAADRLSEIPTADVVTRDCYDRILWENDIMRKQLSEIGKSFGEKMEYVQKVVHAKWNSQVYAKHECSACGFYEVEIAYDYCPHCGAKMDKED